MILCCLDYRIIFLMQMYLRHLSRALSSLHNLMNNKTQVCHASSKMLKGYRSVLHPVMWESKLTTLFFQKDMGCKGKIIKLISLREFKKNKRKRIKKPLAYFMDLAALAGGLHQLSCSSSWIWVYFQFFFLNIYIYLNKLGKMCLFMQWHFLCYFEISVKVSWHKNQSLWNILPLVWSVSKMGSMTLQHTIPTDIQSKHLT